MQARRNAEHGKLKSYQMKGEQIWAETEGNAIQHAREYMLDFVYNYTDYDEEKRAEQMEYWSNPNNYMAEPYED